MKRDRNGEPSDRDAERARWVSRYRSSGLGLRQFAERHGLRIGQLHYWVYQSPKPRGAQGPMPAFREVRLPAAAWTAGPWSTEIGLADGTTVRLAQGTDLTWTLALMESLRRPCSSR